MRISLETTRDEQTPYNLRLEIASLTVDRDKIFNIPVYLEHQNGKKMYDVELCGFRVDAETPEEVVSLVEKLLPGLVAGARFPTYVFIARRSRRLYPVYTVGDEVYATTPGGPVFRHVELAKVRDNLTNYLHQIGHLGTPGKSEKLHVRGVRRSNLALTRPIFYLKKRPVIPDENEFWAPVFISNQGNSIYTYAASGRREVDTDQGHEILHLRSQVAQALMADSRLQEDLDLRADRLLPEYWEKVKPTLQTLSTKLTYDSTKFDMYQDGKYLIAVEYRTDEDRYSFYIGYDKEDLRVRAGKDLTRRGIISNPDMVQFVN